MRQTPSRRGELIAGALTGNLSDAERLELDEARTADPSINAELAELRAMTAQLDAADVTWREEPVSPSLGARIRARTSTAERGHQGEGGRSSSYSSH